MFFLLLQCYVKKETWGGKNPSYPVTKQTSLHRYKNRRGLYIYIIFHNIITIGVKTSHSPITMRVYIVTSIVTKPPKSVTKHNFRNNVMLQNYWSRTSMDNTCTQCNSLFPIARAALGYSTCMECGELAAKQYATKQHTILPLHKQGYMAFTGDDARTVAKQINPKYNNQ